MASTPTTAYLIMEEADGNREILLDSGYVWKLGRSDKCAIAINDETISRNHAMIQSSETEGYCLIDMGSRNGSFVNDRRVSTPVVLRTGDRIALGKARLVFHNPAQGPRGMTPAPVGDSGTTKVFFAQCLVSVLVVDIRDYTGLAQSIDQAVLCQLLGGWFGEADRIMQKQGSAAQKYIGDAVMATWLHGRQNSAQEDILRILRALNQFAEATASLKDRLSLPQALRIGAGLNTGPAAVGNPGTGQVMDFTALGDSVNTAFRLEKASKDLATDVVLGTNTFEYLRPLPAALEYFHPGQAALKGYDALADTWFISFAHLGQFLQAVADDLNRTTDAG